MNYSIFFKVFQATKRVQSNINHIGKDGQSHENLFRPDGTIQVRNNDMGSRSLFSGRNQFSPSKDFNMNAQNMHPSNSYINEQVSSATENTNNFQTKNVETSYSEGNSEIPAHQIEQNDAQTGVYKDVSINTQHVQPTNGYMNEEASIESFNYNSLPSENVNPLYVTGYSENTQNQEEQYHDNTEKLQDSNGNYVQLDEGPQQGNDGSPSSVQYQNDNEKIPDSGTNIQ